MVRTLCRTLSVLLLLVVSQLSFSPAATALGRVENPDSWWSKGVSAEVEPNEFVSPYDNDFNVVLRSFDYSAARLDHRMYVSSGVINIFIDVTYPDGSFYEEGYYTDNDFTHYHSMNIAQSSSSTSKWNFHFDGVKIRGDLYWPYYDDNNKIKTQVDDHRNDSTYYEKAHFRNIQRLNSSRVWQLQTSALFPNVYSMPAQYHYITFGSYPYYEWLQRR